MRPSELALLTIAFWRDRKAMSYNFRGHTNINLGCVVVGPAYPRIYIIIRKSNPSPPPHHHLIPRIPLMVPMLLRMTVGWARGRPKHPGRAQQKLWTTAGIAWEPPSPTSCDWARAGKPSHDVRQTRATNGERWRAHLFNEQHQKVSLMMEGGECQS